MSANIQLTRLEEYICHPQTKEDFNEVVSSYYNHNYRAAVTLLYSIVICDLVLKLHELKDRFDDSRAKGILSTIEKLQEDNPTSPEWEKVLVEEMFKSRYVVDAAAKTHILALQNERNLCAHPVLKESLELFKPAKDAVFGHIVNALNDVLTKSPLAGNKNMLTHILRDIESHKASFLTQKDLSKYLDSKYFKPLNNAYEEFRIFRALWKFVFKLKDADCVQNRDINRWALYCLMDRHKDLFVERIKADAQTLESHIDVEDKELFRNFVMFLNVYPSVYGALTAEMTHLISAKINGYGMVSIALFKVDDIGAHVKSLPALNGNTPWYIINYLTDTDNEHLALDFKIAQYGQSRNYNEADRLFDDYIEPSLSKFSEEQLKKLVEVSDDNGQIYGRWKGEASAKRIKKEIESRGMVIDFKDYPRF